MSAASDMTPDTSSAPRNRPRPLFWSVRRELWENQAIWIAPLAVAGVIILGLSVAVLAPHRMSVSTVQRTSIAASQASADAKGPTGAPPDGGAPSAEVEVAKAKTSLTPAQRRALTIMPFNIVAVALMFTMFMVGIFYCLGAMYGERRDRSILFWKSLPVPDRTTVLAKLLVPMAILPLVTFVVTVGTQVAMLLIGMADLAAHGKTAEVATSIPLGEMSLVLLYGLTTLTLWWAPVYGWLLLVSGWAKRAPFLWAILPPIAVAIAEKLAFDTTYVGSVIQSRLMGSYEEAFTPVAKTAFKAGLVPTIGLEQIDAGKFLSAPGLWIGLVVAAGLVAATVWLRREREPI